MRGLSFRCIPAILRYGGCSYWKSAYPKFGENAVWLDGRNKNPFLPTLENMQRLKEKGIDIIAPPIPVLVRTVENGELALSDYARFAKSGPQDHDLDL